MKNAYPLERLYKELAKLKDSYDSDEELIGVFRMILKQGNIQDKNLFLDEAYKRVPIKNQPIFNSKCLNLVVENNSFIDWYVAHIFKEMPQDRLEKCWSLLKKIKSTHICMLIVDKALPDFSKEDFKTHFLHRYRDFKDNMDRTKTIYHYYVNKYIEKNKLFEEIEGLEPHIKIEILEELLRKKWFDTKENNAQLNLYAKDKDLLNDVLVHVAREFLPLYEENLQNMFVQNKVSDEALIKSARQPEKFDYILKNLVAHPHQKSRMIDSVLVGHVGNKGSGKELLNEFIEKILVSDKKSHLSLEQFCILAKRAIDTYQQLSFQKIMHTMKSRCPDEWIKLKTILQTPERFEVYPGTTFLLGKEHIKKFLRTQLYHELEASLEAPTQNTRKIKI